MAESEAYSARFSWSVCVFCGHVNILHDPKTIHFESLLFLQYLWFLLTDLNIFFSVAIRNDQRAIYHLTLTALPLYRVKYDQMQFCKKLAFSTYSLVMRNMPL